MESILENPHWYHIVIYVVSGGITFFHLMIFRPMTFIKGEYMMFVLVLTVLPIVNSFIAAVVLVWIAGRIIQFLFIREEVHHPNHGGKR